MRIWLGLAIAATLPAPALAQQGAPSLKRWTKDIVRSVPRQAAPSLGLDDVCDAAGLAGGGRSDGIIGEKGRKGIIGEKGSEGIIGEKGRNGIIGEKGLVQGRDQVFADHWSSDRFTTFRHVIEGPPGRVNLKLDACTSASGGETVAVYLTDAQGARRTGWRLFVIGTRNGNSRSGTLTLPPIARGRKIGRLPIMVVVENASGRPHTGQYRLTVSR